MEDKYNEMIINITGLLAFNPGRNTQVLYNVLVQVGVVTSKKISSISIIIQYSKLGIRVASRVAERLKTFRKLGNIGKVLNFGGDIDECPVSLPEIKLWQQQSNDTQKQISNFYFPVQFD